MYKLDMEKGYDHINWEFVEYMMRRLGFGIKWRRRVMRCITTSFFVVMINGGPSSFFKATRDLH